MAFLNRDIKHEIFMHPPPGCANGRNDVVWKLQKSLYGLKQASWSWYTKVKDKLRNLTFSQSDLDHAVFTHSKDGNFCIITLYVDDPMILSNNLPLLLQKKNELMSTFKMKDSQRKRIP